MIEISLSFFGLALSAFFSGTEIAFLRANPLQLSVWKEAGHKTASQTERYLTEPEKYLTTVLVGTNLANVLTSSYAAIALSNLELSQISIIFIIGSVILLFGEVIPKNLAREWPSSIAIASTPLLKFSELILFPLIWITRSYLFLFPNVKKEKKSSLLSRDELKILFHKAETGNNFEPEEKKVISKIFEFGSRSVQTAMTARAEIIGIDENSSITQAIKIMVSTGLSKLVLYNNSMDKISGVLFLHDLISINGPLNKVARRPLFISETMTSNEALRELRRYQSTLAIVVGHDGKASGLVTVEDLIEELFGEFEDVFDKKTNHASRISDNSLILDGRMKLEDLELEYGIILPSGDYETIGGLVIDHLGKIPSAGEKLETANVKFRIIKSTPSQIERIYIKTENPKN